MPQIILSDDKFKLINQIDIDEKRVLVANKAGLYIINLKQNVSGAKQQIVDGEIWDAAFIPNTHYVAYNLNKMG